MLPTFHPNTNEELAAALDFVHQSLEELGLKHDEEQTEENPNTWSLMALDADGYANVAFIAWDEGAKTLRFVAYDQMRERHDLAEGVEDSKCWFSLNTVDQMLMYLTGEVRRILSRARQLQL